MILVIALVVIGVLAVGMIVMVGLERGPSPADVAVSYEHAWDVLDFGTLWVLSGREMRDGLDRRSFVKAKKAAYADSDGMSKLAAGVQVDDVAIVDDDATVITSLALREGSAVCNEIRLRRRNLRWEVVSYSLNRPSQPNESAS
ncbi:MAG: hypothetical protein ACOYNI_09385 [Acidimicrobiia bacterium]